MILLQPKKHDRKYPDERSREVMLKTIEFFETKGKERLEEDDHAAVWYQDFLDFVDQIFDVLVRDFSKFAVQLHGKPSSTPVQAEHCLAMIRKPAVDAERYQRVWQEHVHALRDAYEMNP